MSDRVIDPSGIILEPSPKIALGRRRAQARPLSAPGRLRREEGPLKRSSVLLPVVGQSDPERAVLDDLVPGGPLEVLDEAGLGALVEGSAAVAASLVGAHDASSWSKSP
jgi:hypothetical protein